MKNKLTLSLAVLAAVVVLVGCEKASDTPPKAPDVPSTNAPAAP